MTPFAKSLALRELIRSESHSVLAAVVHRALCIVWYHCVAVTLI